jgi:hypothetical protein
MTIKLQPGSTFDANVTETNTASRTYYLPNQDSGLGLVLDTPQATTSGTYKDFTIPSWAKRITVMLSGVSTNSTTRRVLRLGTAGGIQTSTYTGRTNGGQISFNNANDWTDGVELRHVNTDDASLTIQGTVTFNLLSSASNIWTVTGALCKFNGTSEASVLSGSITLSGAVTTLRFTTGTGTGSDTFDAGTVNVLCE